MKSLADLIGQAITRKQLTKAQGSSLLRHRKLHTEGHTLLMLSLCRGGLQLVRVQLLLNSSVGGIFHRSMPQV